MCRHLAYLGPAVSLASLVLEPPHSLYRQSWAPADMRGGGSVNADGFGLGWYPEPAPGTSAAGAATASPVSPAGSASASPAGPAGSASASPAGPAGSASASPAGPAGAASASPAGPTSSASPAGSAGAGGPASPAGAAGASSIAGSVDLASPADAASADRASGAAVGRVPVRYRRSVPIWGDESLPGLAASVRSGAVLAAVRNGTVGAPLTEIANAPYTRDQWLFSHNGLIGGWPGSVSKLAEGLPVTGLLTLDAPMDSALLWALVQDRLHLGAAEAVASVVRDVAAAAPESRLNLLLTDGEQIVATTWTHSLWVRRTTDSVAVSSEPWTAEGWEEIPDRSLLLATKSTLAVTPLLEGRQ